MVVAHTNIKLFVLIAVGNSQTFLGNKSIGSANSPSTRLLKVFCKR